MNGYELSRNWFAFAYENNEAKPVHTALYFWIVERANACGWKKIIDIQTEKSMECLGITDWRTYKCALQFLSDSKFITWVEKSKNQFTCNRVTLNVPEVEGDSIKNAYALNAHPDAEAIAEAIAEAYPKPTVKAIAEALQSYINLKTSKPINPETLKQITDEFTIFWDAYAKKVDYKKSFAKWQILTSEDRKEILSTVKAYVEANPKNEFRKNPLTYLNGACWKDELPTSTAQPQPPRKKMTKADHNALFH